MIFRLDDVEGHLANHFIMNHKCQLKEEKLNNEITYSFSGKGLRYKIIVSCSCGAQKEIQNN